jgi:type I restriction enzyme S subunit
MRLGECLEIARGGSPRPIDDYFTDSPDGLNWIKIGDVSATGKYITSTAQKIRPEGLSKTRRVSVGDFLLSNSMSFGRPYILRIDGCIHDGWLVLSDKGKTFNQDFLYNLLRSRSVQEQFTSLAAGSGVKNLNISVVQTVTVKVPSLDEQERIAVTVNEWESLLDFLNIELNGLEVARRALLDGVLDGGIDIPSAYDVLLDEVA